MSSSKRRRLARLRVEAHRAFDKLWLGFGIRRIEAYNYLSIELGIPFEECHFSLMNEELIEESFAASRRIEKKLRRLRSTKGKLIGAKRRVRLSFR